MRLVTLGKLRSSRRGAETFIRVVWVILILVGV